MFKNCILKQNDLKYGKIFHFRKKLLEYEKRKIENIFKSKNSK